MYICDVHKSSLRFHCQRFSNNSNPEFTDEEVLTIYLFCGYCQRYFNIKEIQTFAKEYLIMVSKIAVLSNVLRTPKYAFRNI